MTWPESVEVALCFGWIDGIRRRIDDLAYSIRFTPRRRTSNWSAVNITTAEELIAAGRMQPAGLAAFQAREDRRSKVYAYERPAPAALTPEESAAFQSHELAWSYFESCPAGYRRVILHWISSAKRQETRARRLGQLIEACHNRLRLRS